MTQEEFCAKHGGSVDIEQQDGCVQVIWSFPIMAAVVTKTSNLDWKQLESEFLFAKQEFEKELVTA